MNHTSVTKLMKLRITVFSPSACPSEISVPYEPRSRRLSQLVGSTGATLCEMQVLDFWSELRIHVVAVQAKADDLAHFGFGASAFAMGPLLPPLDERRVGLGRSRFRNTPFLLG